MKTLVQSNVMSSQVEKNCNQSIEILAKLPTICCPIDLQYFYFLGKTAQVGKDLTYYY